jgi:uncharacterized membrane protein YdjX (TVP38/TMEM64 family)
MFKDSLTNIINSLRQNKFIQIGVVILFVVVGVLIMTIFDLAATQAFLQENRGQAALVSIMIYFLLGFTFIPSSPLTLFLAILIGPIETSLIATIGNTLAALIEYQVGATVGDIFNFEEKMEYLPFGLGELPIASTKLLLAARLLPFGKRGFSFVCGAYQVPLNKYLWTTLLMYLLNASILAFGGAGLANLF